MKLITCKELIDFLDDYIDGDLPAKRQAEFERHLDACPSCVEYLQSFRQTVQLGKAAYADPGANPPPEVPEDLIRAILAARRK